VIGSGVLVLVVALIVLLLGGPGSEGAARLRVRRARPAGAATSADGAAPEGAVPEEAVLEGAVPRDVAPAGTVSEAVPADAVHERRNAVPAVPAAPAPAHVVPGPAAEPVAAAALRTGAPLVGVPRAAVPSSAASRPPRGGAGTWRSDLPVQPSPWLPRHSQQRPTAPRVGAGSSPPGPSAALRLPRGRRPSVTRTDLVAVTTAVVASLRAGSDPSRAWQEAIGVRPEPGHAPTVDEVLGALSGGGAAAHDHGVVRSVTTLVGATRLALLLGAPLAVVLERCAATVEADDETAAELDAALAGPRQTATLLGWLPAVGLLLGLLLGADPVGVLTDGGWGTCCGAAGIGLTVLGRLWVRRMIARARAAGGLD
jgi:tight adherence protein B